MKRCVFCIVEFFEAASKSVKTVKLFYLENFPRYNIVNTTHAHTLSHATVYLWIVTCKKQYKTLMIGDCMASEVIKRWPLHKSSALPSVKRSQAYW